MTYPLPTNISGMGGVAQYIFSVDGNFFNLLVLTLWVLFFLGFTASNRVTPGVAFTVTSWGIFLLSLVLQIAGVLHNSILFLTGIASAIGFIWVLNEGT